MAGLVPADDLPSGIVPESDLPDVKRKTPRELSIGQKIELGAKLGRAALNVTPFGSVMGVTEKIGELTDKASEGMVDVLARRGVSPEVAAGAGVATNVTLGAIPALFGGGGTKAVALKDLVKMDTLNEARKIGLNVPPSAVGSGHIERGLESLGGKADIGREMSARNREAIQVAARKEAGLPENVPITEETLAAARRQIALPYREISNISPRAKTAIEQMQLAREEAKGYWREYNGPNHPMAAKKEAQRLDAKAEAYEKLIDQEAQKVGNPGLLDALKMARVRLAKNYDIEKALNVGTGEIDARMLGRMVDKRGTAAMTGDLGTIGKFAQAFPDFVQPKSVATDVSALKPYAALLAGAGGYGVSEHYSGSPYGAVLGALPFISPAARSLALSKAMQSGALSAGRSGERAAQASLIPLSRIGRTDDDAGP